MGADLPLTLMADASKTAMLWLPGVFSVALNVPVPPTIVALIGRTAALSLLVKRSVAA